MIIAIFFFLLFSSICSSGKYKGPHGGCHSAAYYGEPNLLEINELSTSMKLVKEVKNGKMYHVSVPLPTPTTFDIVHLWGTPKEMGIATGQLRDTKVYVDYIDKVWEYLESEIEGVLPGWIPKWLEDLIANLGLEAALDLTYDITKSWSNPSYYEELEGIASSTGIDFKKLVRIHMLPGLTQGACSMLGAFGSAVNPTGKNKILQLRALDWDMDGPFTNFPQITVYHPNSGDGHAFANVGMMAFVGGLTGMSERRLGISEIGVSFPDSTFGKESRMGVPFIWLLRDILQYDINLQNATDRMINTRRTCDLILGVGDGNEKEFNAFQYSYEELNVFGWENARPDATWHPKIEDVVYYGMDWECPSYSSVLANQTKKYLGKLDAETAITYLTGVEESGDNHIAYYGLDTDEMWVSFAAPLGTKEPREAYSRQFTHVSCKSLWDEKKPDL